MSQNYNLNSGFGFNIFNGKTQKAPIDKLNNIEKTKENNIFAAVGDYFDKNQKVFSGDVEKEINLYSRQMMIVGMNLKQADKNIRSFDINI